MPSNRLEQPNRATQSVIRDVMMPNWLIRPINLDIPQSMRRNIAALANVSTWALSKQIDSGIAPLVAGARSESDAEDLAQNFGVTGIDFEVIKAQSGLSAPALLFASALASAPLFVLTEWYFGVIPIAVALGWLMTKGASNNQKIWNALHGQISKHKDLINTQKAIQSARRAILKGDMSPVIVQDLSVSLDKLEDNLEALTLSGKTPSKNVLNEMTAAAEALEEAAINHQDIDSSASEEAKKKANLLKNTSAELS